MLANVIRNFKEVASKLEVDIYLYGKEVVFSKDVMIILNPSNTPLVFDEDFSDIRRVSVTSNNKILTYVCEYNNILTYIVNSEEDLQFKLEKNSYFQVDYDSFLSIKDTPFDFHIKELENSTFLNHFNDKLKSTRRTGSIRSNRVRNESAHASIYGKQEISKGMHDYISKFPYEWSDGRSKPLKKNSKSETSLDG